jgi:hypothetical protein
MIRWKKTRTLCRHRIEINGGRLPLSSPAVECLESEVCSLWKVPGGCGAKVIEMADGSLLPLLVDDKIRYLPLEEWIGQEIPEECVVACP